MILLHYCKTFFKNNFYKLVLQFCDLQLALYCECIYNPVFISLILNVYLEAFQFKTKLNF